MMLCLQMSWQRPAAAPGEGRRRSIFPRNTREPLWAFNPMSMVLMYMEHIHGSDAKKPGSLKPALSCTGSSKELWSNGLSCSLGAKGTCFQLEVG